jgi:hypothetical protein
MRSILIFLIFTLWLDNRCVGLNHAAKVVLIAETALVTLQGGHAVVGVCKDHVARREEALTQNQNILDAFDNENPACRPRCCNGLGIQVMNGISCAYDRTVGRIFPYRDSSWGRCLDVLLIIAQAGIEWWSVAQYMTGSDDNYWNQIASSSVSILLSLFWFAGFYC